MKALLRGCFLCSSIKEFSTFEIMIEGASCGSIITDLDAIASFFFLCYFLFSLSLSCFLTFPSLLDFFFKALDFFSLTLLVFGEKHDLLTFLEWTLSKGAKISVSSGKRTSWRILARFASIGFLSAFLFKFSFLFYCWRSKIDYLYTFIC